MSPRRNWDSPNPSLASECAPPPPPRTGGGDTLACGWGVGGVLIPTAWEKLSTLPTSCLISLNHHYLINSNLTKYFLLLVNVLLYFFNFCWLNSDPVIQSLKKIKFLFTTTKAKNAVKYRKIYPTLRMASSADYSEPEFVNLLRSSGIDSQPGVPVWQPYLTYRPARLHRMAESILWNRESILWNRESIIWNRESILWNRFLGSLNVYKFGLWW